MSFAGKKDKAKGFKGKVTAVEAHAIVVSAKKSAESKTFQVDDSTKISVDRQEGKHLADIKDGMKVKVTVGAKGDTATADVRTAAAGQPPSRDTLQLVRVRGKWKIASLAQ